ncbi:MAG: patatin-like phospholipase family protein [Blastocatellia bacterium]
MNDLQHTHEHTAPEQTGHGPWPRPPMYLTYAWFMRFQILTAILLAGFPIAAFTVARVVLENLFDLNPAGITWVTVMALFCAWIIMMTSRLALLYGPERFGIDPTRASWRLKWRHSLYVSLLAAPVIMSVAVKNIRRDMGDASALWWDSGAIVAGFLIALVLLTATEAVNRRITGPLTRQMAPDLMFPSESPMLDKFAGREDRRPAFWKPSVKMGRMLTTRIPRYIGAGYLDYDCDCHERFPLKPGQGSAIAMFLVFGALYAVAGLVSYPGGGLPMAVRAPSLALVLTLFSVFCITLSGIAFFLDRYRVPVTLTAVLYLFAGAMLVSRVDNYFASFPMEPGLAQSLAGAGGNQLTPDKVLRMNGARVILVAANGGGIQSAAWTARVLTGLEEICRDGQVCPPGTFGKTVSLLSGVSGGSVGVMYYVNTYGPGHVTDRDKLEHALASSWKSSLDEIAWGMAYPDLFRGVFPFLAEIPMIRATDRGSVLERHWSRNAQLTDTLGKWRLDTARGDRPGVIFNATIADSGQPFLLSTVDPPEKLEVTTDFRARFPGADIPIVTAVRLSATFPVVTPASRTELDVPKRDRFHVVDGGYYDNYGMAALVRWLDEALLKTGQGEVTEVMVVRVHGAPTRPDNSGIDNGLRGFFYQLTAPIAALSGVRSTGQYEHTNLEFRLLAEKWQRRGVTIRDAIFEFEGRDAPLSWRLTQAQIEDIKKEWAKQTASNPAYQRMCEFLRGR